MDGLMHAPNAVAMAWRRPAPARYAVMTDPMRMDIGAGDLHRVPADATFADLIAGQGQGWLCQVAGEGCESGTYLLPACWHTMPRPGDVVVFHKRALGGGNSGRSLLQLAVVIVAAWATAGASTAFTTAGYGAAGSFGASAAGALAGAAVTLAGNALINALVPLDASNNPNQPGASPTYNVALQGNRARLGQARPVGYGHNHTFPDFACEAYSEFVDNRQIYSAVLEVTEGAAAILRVSIADTPVDHLADVEYLFIGPGQPDGETLADQTLVKTNVMASLEAATAEMEMLKVVGPVVVVQRGRLANKLRMDVMLPRGLDAGRTITWKVQAREINGYEQPDDAVTAGGWITLADETYSTASATPVRLSYRYTVDPARYEMRAYRTDIRATEANAAHDLSLLGMACEIDEDGIDTTIAATYVVLRMKASQQLNGFGQFRVRVLWTRMLPIWNGTTWSAPAVTRSIAWAVADILRNTAYGRGLPDSQIDLTALLALDAVWAARFDKYDGTFDTTGDTWGALMQVLRVGRAVPLIRGSRYTFIRDAEDLEPVALYGMNNTRAGSFSLALHVPERDQVTALDVEYWDYARWDWITLTVQYVGSGEPEPFIAFEGDTAPSPYTKAENRVRMRLPGAIGPAHVARVASNLLACTLFRQSKATYRTHLDGLLPAYCAPVRIANDIPSWGQSGSVVDWDAGTGTVTTTEPLDWSAGGTHYMQLQGHQGGVVTWTVTEGAEPDEAVVADDLGFTPSFDSANRERTRYSFGPAANMGALCRVQSITPRGERDIEHRVVLEDARVHTADEPWMPVGGVDPDPPISDGSSGPADGSDVYVVRLVGEAIEAIDEPASITLNDNGTASTVQAVDGGALANQWMQNGIVPLSVADDYEVRATVVPDPYGTPGSTDGLLTTGTLGVWLPLGVASYTWTKAPTNPGSWAFTAILLEIRNIADGSVQDSAVYTLAAFSTV